MFFKGGNGGIEGKWIQNPHAQQGEVFHVVISI